MAQKLPSKGLIKILHIALFFLLFQSGIQLLAQSVLLPGDVVVVSVHADTQAVDIIPLIDIEKGTQLYLSDGIWNDSTGTLTGNELEITFKKSILAGTNLHINHLDDERIEISGSLAFEGNTHRLFVYQKENVAYRFVFGMGWGEHPVWNENSGNQTGSDIPSALKVNKNVLLTLGNKDFYQYYVKNGASGTHSMLQKYVGDASHWRGNDSVEFPAFGTSFNLLEPPVVLFENSVSTVTEDDSVAVLNVAIYGHDGSRLTVDVVFDTLHSTMSHQDVSGFEKATINFTGLVGDAVYEINVPIKDDEVFERRETGIFTLQNLVKGNFGDFLTHSLLLQDNDEPELLISEIQPSNGNQSLVTILNDEEVEISLKGWSIVADKGTFTFKKDIYLSPQQSIIWIDGKSENEIPNTENQYYSDLEHQILKSGGGTLVLMNPSGEAISEFNYPVLRNNEEKTGKIEKTSEKNSSEKSIDVNEDRLDFENKVTSVVKSPKSGWEVLTNRAQIEALANDKIVFSWDKEKLRFSPFILDAFDENQSQIVFGYLEENEITDSVYTDSTHRKALDENNLLELNLSASDRNENMMIDGIEGLNLAFNQLDIPVSVDKLKEHIRTADTENEINPALYSIEIDTLGAMKYVELEAGDIVQPGAAFWLLIDRPMVSQTFEFQQSDLIQNEFENVEEVELNQKYGNIIIWIETDSHKDFIEVEVTDSLQHGFLSKDLNSYPEVFLPNQTFLNAAFRGGNEFYSKISVASTMEQEMNIPLTISSSESGIISFKTTMFENIPNTWRIQLEDKLNNKVINIRKDAVFNFKYTIPDNISNTEEGSEINLNQFSVPNRFVLRISPAASEKKLAEEEVNLPGKLELHQNFPNPFNPVTTISFYLPEPEEIRLSVFNIVGQPVAVISEGSLSAGEHQFEWDATDKPSGMYIYQLEAGKSVMTRKMTLVK